MSPSPLRRIRAVATAGIVLAGLTALPATAASGPTLASTASSTASQAVAAPSARVLDPTTVIPARRFVDSVGVGVHLTVRQSSYVNFPAVKRSLLDLGVRHIRDSINWDREKYLELGRAGIKTLATVPRGADGEAALNQVLTNVKAYAPALSSIGGPNEYETTVTDWVTKLRDFQRRIYTKVNADPVLNGLPVLAPSLQTRTDERRLGDLSRYLDLGAVHAYPYGQLPEDIAVSYMHEAAVNAGDKPVVITETGMANGSDAERRQHGLSYSERAAGIYTPRLVMEYFRLGAQRTYIYELLNEDNRPGMSPRNRYFGLMRNDFSPKPAYNSMRTLLRTLADNGATANASPLSYSVRSDRNLRQLTFQKSDGSYYVALWNPVSVWSGGPQGHDLYPAPVRASLNLPFAASSVQVIDLQRGLAPVRTVRNAATVPLEVTPSIQLVKVTR